LLVPAPIRGDTDGARADRGDDARRRHKEPPLPAGLSRSHPAVVLAVPVLVGLVLTLFAWPSARLAPRGLPLGVVGPVPGSLAADGSFSVHRYADAAAARHGIRQREVYESRRFRLRTAWVSTLPEPDRGAPRCCPKATPVRQQLTHRSELEELVVPLSCLESVALRPREGCLVSERQRTVEALVELSRELGAPEHDYAILAEGNTSARLDGESFLLKASGFSLGSADESSFVEMRTAAVLELLDHPPASDEELSAALATCRVAEGPRPSTEATLHALALTLGGASFVGHTHPTAVNSILCSEHASALTDGVLFPDEIVVCGRRPLFVPYVDPGVPLGLEVRERLLEHLRVCEGPPKVIYLQNHGLFALGRSPAEVLQVTAMAVKTARIMLGTFAAAGPHYLREIDAARIEARPDELYRQRRLTTI